MQRKVYAVSKSLYMNKCIIYVFKHILILLNPLNFKKLNPTILRINPTTSPTKESEESKVSKDSDYDNSVEEGAAKSADPNSAVVFSISAVYVAIISLLL